MIKSYFNTLEPYGTVKWVQKKAAIGDFEKEIEAPEEWSQTAVNIVASKYLYKDETSVWQLIDRVCRTITSWGLKDGYFDLNGKMIDAEARANHFYKELAFLMLHQMACFNSPVLFNVGLDRKAKSHGYTWNGTVFKCKNPYENPQVSACFIQSVNDDMQSIMDLAKTQAMIFKYGSGTGTNLSSLRSYREELSGGGYSSGPLSFMQIYDKIAGIISAGGTTRRGASMRILDVEHPDILEFINCKSEIEELARDLLARGHDSKLVYESLPYQNANHSVRLSDIFMEAVKNNEPWQTIPVTSGEMPCYQASDLFDLIAKRAWGCGDPGIQFGDIINKWNPTHEEIRASNPCGEFLFPDNSACNLASLNLRKFQDQNGKLNIKTFQAAVKIMITAMDIMVDNASYPTQEICQNSHDYRPLGLGYTNLGGFLMAAGLPYDSDEARSITSKITAYMQLAAIEASTDLAKQMGKYPKYDEKINQVLNLHYNAIINLKLPYETFKNTFVNAQKHGLRNAQLTLLAPTGTISFLMDCDTTGIEPELALVKTKHLVGGGTINQVNKSVKLGLKACGYNDLQTQEIADYLYENKTIRNCPHLKQIHYNVFATALGDNQISWNGHVDMMASVQPFISGGISKTVNLPENATIDDIKEVFLRAYYKGLKSITVYRDNSKGTQPVTIKEKKTIRQKLPETRNSVTHKFEVGGHEGYITVGLYENNQPGELFITSTKEGSTIGGLLNSFGVAISMGLQYGIPLKTLIEKFKYVKFDPAGFTKNSDIKMSTSIIDYIFKWLELTFIKKQPSYPDAYEGTIETTGNMCPECGSEMNRAGMCYLCNNCGFSGGCS